MVRNPLAQKLYFSISEVAEITDLQPHILRTWEKEFTCLRPRRLRGKNRAYRQRDIKLILLIKKLLYEERFTTQGVRQKLKNDAELVKHAIETENPDLVGGEDETEGHPGEPGPDPEEPVIPPPPVLLASPAEPPAPNPPSAAPDAPDHQVIEAIRTELRQILRLLA